MRYLDAQCIKKGDKITIKRVSGTYEIKCIENIESEKCINITVQWRNGNMILSHKDVLDCKYN
jgi:hypothetical protein